MSRKLIIFGLILVAMIFLPACTAERSIEVDGSNNGSSIEMAVGETLIIKLEGNPTTGYQWEMLPNDGGLVELQGEPEYKSDSNLVGSGGLYRFTLKAIKPGTTAVELKYYRSFEPEVAPIQTYQINIVLR